MRRKHKDILKKKIINMDYSWFFRNAINGCAIPASYYLKRIINKPVFGGLIVTYRCNETCPMCVVTKKKDARIEISTDEFISIIDQFSRLNVSGISITGGEPLLREDIFVLIKRLKHHNIAVSMSTNGLLLQKEKIVRDLLLSGVDSVAISIDGSDSKEHDISRGISGAFQKTIIGIENILRLRNEMALGKKVFITIATVINNKNFRNFEKLVVLARKLGVDNVSLNPVHKTSKEELNSENSLYFQEFNEEIADLTKTILALKEKYPIIDSSKAYINLLFSFFQHKPLPIRCYAPYMALYVDCYKDIYPCGGYFYERKPVFNLNDEKLKDVWKSLEFEKVREKLRNCRSCYYSCMAEMSLNYSRFP